MWLTALLACTPDPTSATDAGLAPVYTSVEYVDAQRWLCRPELDDDACAIDLDLTEVAADGGLTVVPHVPAVEPGVDCLYIYPTTSLDPTDQADWIAGPEEAFVVALQAARYSRVCRVFAPLYRQVSVSGLFAERGDFELAYTDVEDAFRHWMAHDVIDSPYLLIGHSQGTGHLTQLIAEVIEPDPELHGRMVAAHLIGGFVTTAVGSDLDGSFALTPTCTSPDQTGCVVHYNAYRDSNPPGDDAVFAVAPPGEQVLCANPASLAGGPASLSGALPVDAPPEVAALIGPQHSPFADPVDANAITTDWYSTPGLVRGECVATDDASWLEITVDADVDDPRADQIGGDLLPGWGLHLVDVALAMGDLVDLAETQITAY